MTVRDNTVDIFSEWFSAQGAEVIGGTVLTVNGKVLDLVSLANFLEIKEKQGLRYTDPQTS